ncbi:hypothetical protein PUNSTDRAFT_72291, partial [Punctularia strigosozonata HHB-11173 SS5]|uniref:uncharacterized protein n=1 Tax=Punctularia strigosozonata (strain HHB-11173) TaxID=741275 RepID=UPI00044162D8
VPPHVGTKLYMAQIDPHLTRGCEIAVDINEHLINDLECVQLKYLRRVLGLSSRSPIAPLFAETGMMPLRHRRLTLALRYLDHVIRAPPERYISSALQLLFALSLAGHSTWLTDLLFSLRRLPHAPIDATVLDLLDLGRLTEIELQTL